MDFNRLTMKSFQRLATIATRNPSALSRPWIVLATLGSPHLLVATPTSFNHQLSTSISFGSEACQASKLFSMQKLFDNTTRVAVA